VFSCAAFKHNVLREKKRGRIGFLRGCFMSKSIYVGNLPWAATEEQVRDLFTPYGEVLSVKLVSDRETGRARGFGFVEMEDGDADAAIEKLDNSSFGGRTLRVNEAKPRAPRQPRY
jgi:RNA recognition motif-containing protein